MLTRQINIKTEKFKSTRGEQSSLRSSEATQIRFPEGQREAIHSKVLVPCGLSSSRMFTPRRLARPCGFSLPRMFTSWMFWQTVSYKARTASQCGPVFVACRLGQLSQGLCGVHCMPSSSLHVGAQTQCGLGTALGLFVMNSVRSLCSCQFEIRWLQTIFSNRHVL